MPTLKYRVVKTEREIVERAMLTEWSGGSAPLALSDRQLQFIQQAAKSVPPRHRDAFLGFVSNHLHGIPSDAAVEAATNAALNLIATEV